MDVHHCSLVLFIDRTHLVKLFTSGEQPVEVVHGLENDLDTIMIHMSPDHVREFTHFLALKLSTMECHYVAHRDIWVYPDYSSEDDHRGEDEGPGFTVYGMHEVLSCLTRVGGELKLSGNPHANALDDFLIDTINRRHLPMSFCLANSFEVSDSDIRGLP